MLKIACIALAIIVLLVGLGVAVTAPNGAPGVLGMLLAGSVLWFAYEEDWHRD